MCERCILYIRTSLRTLQAGIYDNSHLIKNLFRLPKKNLGSFARVSTLFLIGHITEIFHYFSQNEGVILTMDPRIS